MRGLLCHSLVCAALAAGCADATSDPAPLDGGSADAAFGGAGGADAALTDADLSDVGAPDAGPLDAEPRDADVPDAELPDADPSCVPGAPCDPILIDRLPFSDSGDTAEAPSAFIDRYACAPDTDESGPEVYYTVVIEAPGLLTARVDDLSGDDVDVDLHLIEGLDGEACLARDNRAISAYVEAGRYTLVVDSWVNSQGVALSGPYTLTVDWAPRPFEGACAVSPQAVEMVWSSCAPGIDCEDIGGARYLNTPALGPVVKEAHLVTVDEEFPDEWPTSARDGLEAHYALSEAATGYVMARREPWAPEGEGGSRWGQAAHFRPLPVVDEAFYINMYWRQRPAPGTRMIVMHPSSGRAVVAAGGYETGPGANTAVAGVSEEIHHHLGTTHLDPLWIGFAADQGLPLGPIECTAE